MNTIINKLNSIISFLFIIFFFLGYILILFILFNFLLDLQSFSSNNNTSINDFKLDTPTTFERIYTTDSVIQQNRLKQRCITYFVTTKELSDSNICSKFYNEFSERDNIMKVRKRNLGI